MLFILCSSFGRVATAVCHFDHLRVALSVRVSSCLLRHSRMTTARRSGLAASVLTCYREVLRGARAQPSPPARLAAAALARQRFRDGAATVPRLDIQKIEFLLRQARKAVRAAAAGGATYTAVGTAEAPQQRSLRLMVAGRRAAAAEAVAAAAAAR